MNGTINSELNLNKLINIDCKLPYELGNIIWNFKPYNEWYKIIQIEIIKKHIYKIINKIINDIIKCKGITYIDFTLEDYIDICYYDIYRRIKKKYSDEQYIDLASKQINIKTNIMDNFINELDYVLGSLSIEERLCYLKNIKININIDYEAYLGNFEPDIILNRLEWIKIRKCPCGNINKYIWSDSNFDIIINTKWKNIYSREYNYCCW
jgi:hypothetical protein